MRTRSTLRILRLLEEAGELAAGEIVARLVIPQATASTHLGCLRWCAFVDTRREGCSVIYRIADVRVGELVDLADSLLADNAEHVACCAVIDSVSVADRCESSFSTSTAARTTRHCCRSCGTGSPSAGWRIRELRRVESAEAADRERFLGSPTVRVDGVDVEPGAEERTDFGLKCRIYRTPEGMSGMPSPAWIEAAIDTGTPAANGDRGATRRRRRRAPRRARVVDHLDHLAVAEGGQVGDRAHFLPILGGSLPEDDDDLLTGVDQIDQLAYGTALDCPAHELEHLPAPVAGPGRRGVAAVPPDIRGEEIGDRLEFTTAS